MPDPDFEISGCVKGGGGNTDPEITGVPVMGSWFGLKIRGAALSDHSAGSATANN